MKKLICSLLVFTLVLSVIPVSAFAAENTMEVIVVEEVSYIARSAGEKTARKEATVRDADGNMIWKAILTATFEYTGTTSECTASSCSVTIYDSTWHTVSKSATHSGNTAAATVTMGKKLLGVTITKKTVNIQLTCDANGNLS